MRNWGHITDSVFLVEGQIRDVSLIFLRSAVRLYRYLLAPMLAPSCRFHPSCSQYALDALDKHGPLRASVQIAGRLLRCNPFSRGGHDPV